MESQNISYQRFITYAVPAEQALALRLQGKTLAEIRDELAPGVSLPTISRAIARARITENLRRSHAHAGRTDAEKLFLADSGAASATET